MPAGMRCRFKGAAVFAFVALLLVLGRGFLERAPELIPGVALFGSGCFVERGALPADRTVAPRDERGDFWSSWGNAGNAKGELRLGPFPAPRILGLRVMGYPYVGGNRLFLENTRTGEHLDVTESNIGEGWSDIRLWTPRSWRTVPVVLHAVENSAGPFGWLAVGAPRDVPLYAAWWNPFAQRLYGFAGAGLVLFLLQSAAMHLLRGRREIPAAFLPLASVALVAAAAYGVFWIFFVSAVAGRAVVWAILLGAFGIFALGQRPQGPEAQRDSATPLFLAVAVGMAYFGILFLHGSERPMYEVAARRFCDKLAVDSQLPEMFAEHLIRGEDPRRLASGWWFSSERPPLQCACDLVLAYPIAASGTDFDTAAQAAGIWLQLSWVLAAWGWLRTLSASAGAAVLVIGSLAATGFFAVNTVYVWPKLLAAAMVVAGFSLIFLVPADELETGRFAAAGGLVALGLLSHASVAFSLFGLLPLALMRFRRHRLHSWSAAAAVFAALVLPWTAYQRWYDPPGNYLVKWYMGGARIRDDRGVSETIISAYRSAPLAALVHARITNIQSMFKGPWSEWSPVNGTDLAELRNSEYFSVFVALGWWNLGFVALGFLFIGRWRNRTALSGSSPLLESALWCLSTLAAWVLLLFLPESAVIQQGSYACMLMLFLSLAWALWTIHRWLFGFVAFVAVLHFIQIWLPANPSRPGPLHLDGAVLAVGGTLAILATLTRLARLSRA